jgi:hypothetical protein
MTTKRRTILKLGVFLLLGAAANVAVAWGCSFFELGVSARRELCEKASVPSKYGSCVVVEFSRSGFLRLVAGNDGGFGWQEPVDDMDAVIPGWADIYLNDYQLGMPPSDTWTLVYGSGLPCLALRGALPARRNRSFDDAQGILYPTSDANNQITSRLLLLQPIWPGFAINTVFYAGVCWLLFAAPSVLRRRLRLRRGRCPNCAYPIGTWGGDLCTECGRPVRSVAAVRPSPDHIPASEAES